eukprot:CAMPEP_0171610168 /NCGR_PEP_ID=MMETSP0990-20121206/9892_1 /TAXON_ID=483369 /ORGANISM="non described non described, Strain CCMP2098" /LENGTH=171 /DNA_ID=CAMNT_0012173533 /DNA_START=41 /DNA_END=556 /DNA_ORIENTATION=-
MASSPNKDEIMALVNQWAAHFGFLDGKIDLKDDDLSAFSTPDVSLTAHAPLWGTKAGEEKPIPAADVRKNLAGMLKYVTIERHAMQMAVHDKQICLFFVVKVKVFKCCCSLMTVPLAFIATTVETPEGLRMSEIHEWPAASPEEAQKVLVKECGWPDTTKLEEHVAFGALS